MEKGMKKTYGVPVEIFWIHVLFELFPLSLMNFEVLGKYGQL